MTNVLMISYYYKPYLGVGAKRIGYWFEELRKDKNFKVTLITGYPGEDVGSGVLRIIPEKKSIFYFLIKDEGLNWYKPLKRALAAYTGKVDIVLFTGSPFMQMLLGKFVRKNLNARVILDFRDPFAINPRFRNHPAKIMVKKFFEAKMIKSADALITVNKYCMDLISSGSHKKRVIIENGYDERVFERIPEEKTHDDGLVFVYSGSLYRDRDPSEFLKALSRLSAERKVSFLHIGEKSNSIAPEHLRFVRNTGVVEYEKAVSLIKSADFGLIFTSGEPFESTTKIFDYIGCNIPVIVVSDKIGNGGSLRDITDNYPNSYWSSNDCESIYSLLVKLTKGGAKRKLPVFDFSRKKGLVQLKELCTTLQNATEPAAQKSLTNG